MNATTATSTPTPTSTGEGPDSVLTCGEAGLPRLKELLARFGLELVEVEAGAEIPGSFWGESEAGLIGRKVYARPDTPVHSLFHEACHTICATPERREKLHTEAGGNDQEENAVCYLQLLLAEEVPAFGKKRALKDMDAWGYSFRLGSAKAWFEQDAEDDRRWLVDRGLIEEDGRITWRLRDTKVD
jgi:hypothetical protein